MGSRDEKVLLVTTFKNAMALFMALRIMKMGLGKK
jgi:hypothetical protein